MKKLFSLLLAVVVLCSMFAVPTFAAPHKDVGVIDIKSGTDFCNALDSLEDGRKVVLNLKTENICIDHEINLNASNCSILIFASRSIYSPGSDNVKIYPRYLKEDDNYRFLNINGDNVNLYFDNEVICKDFRKTGSRDSSGSGGAIFVDGENCFIACGRFNNCTANLSGGAIYVNRANATIAQCEFQKCRAVNRSGGAIKLQDKNGRVDGCVFNDNSCRNQAVDSSKFYGDDVAGYRALLKDPDGIVHNCRSNSKREDNYYMCTVTEDFSTFKAIEPTGIFGTQADFENRYSRPTMTDYARNAMQNNKNCDVIRPDIANKTESENKLFTIEGKNAYGALWEVDWQNALTIKAKDGYTITRIEAVVQDKTNYGALSIDNGTKADRTKDNPNYYGDPIEKDYIASFEDVNAKSVTFTTKGNITNWGTVAFTDFIIYYKEGDPEIRPVIEESPEYTRDGETYDVFTFDRDTYTAGSGSTKSELKGFLLTDTAVPARGHIYGWATDITITAPEGYTITRIEGKPVHFENNVAFLKSNAGTIVDQGKPLAKDGIVRINDINASSVEISCTSDYVEFGEFLVFYEKNFTLGSVFSGGTLWLIIGVAAVAVATAVVIVVVKKKKPATANGAAVDNPEKEDE